MKRLTARADRVLRELAQSEAREMGRECDGVTLEYVVLALSREHDGMPGRALQSLGVFLVPLRKRVEDTLNQRNWEPLRHRPRMERFIEVERAAEQEANHLGSASVDAEHVALALIRLDEHGGDRVLPLLGINGKAWRMEILRLMELRASA